MMTDMEVGGENGRGAEEEGGEEYAMARDQQTSGSSPENIQTLSAHPSRQDGGSGGGGARRAGDGEQRRMVDITRDKPIKVTVRVVVPVRDHPKFNFVGKLLGPKGNSLKRLQEDTMTKMAILGRGSMRDKHKEEELRCSGDPKFSHLNDDLHVEITAFAPPAEAHARIAYALAEVRRFLVPDYNDEIRQEQMWEMQILNTAPSNASSRGRKGDASGVTAAPDGCQRSPGETHARTHGRPSTRPPARQLVRLPAHPPAHPPGCKRSLLFQATKAEPTSAGRPCHRRRFEYLTSSRQTTLLPPSRRTPPQPPEPGPDHLARFLSSRWNMPQHVHPRTSACVSEKDSVEPHAHGQMGVRFLLVRRDTVSRARGKVARACVLRFFVLRFLCVPTF